MSIDNVSNPPDHDWVLPGDPDYEEVLTTCLALAPEGKNICRHCGCLSSTILHCADALERLAAAASHSWESESIHGDLVRITCKRCNLVLEGLTHFFNVKRFLSSHPPCDDIIVASIMDS